MDNRDAILVLVLVGAALAVALAWQVVATASREPVPDVFRKAFSDGD